MGKSTHTQNRANVGAFRDKCACAPPEGALARAQAPQARKWETIWSETFNQWITLLRSEHDIITWVSWHKYTEVCGEPKCRQGDDISLILMMISFECKPATLLLYIYIKWSGLVSSIDCMTTPEDVDNIPRRIPLSTEYPTTQIKIFIVR